MLFIHRSNRALQWRPPLPVAPRPNTKTQLSFLEELFALGQLKLSDDHIMLVVISSTLRGEMRWQCRCIVCAVRHFFGVPVSIKVAVEKHLSARYLLNGFRLASEVAGVDLAQPCI